MSLGGGGNNINDGFVYESTGTRRDEGRGRSISEAWSIGVFWKGGDDDAIRYPRI